MGRSWIMGISAILSLSILVLGYLIFWLRLEDTFKHIHLAFFALPLGWILVDGVALARSLAVKSFDCELESCFFILRNKIVASVIVTYVKFAIMMSFLFLMVCFLVPSEGPFKGESYIVWSWGAAQILLAIFLDKILPLNEE
ncbi:hypothetical protein [Alcanivorax quisquiliarum]|uniref:Transmembrane protein n=1 Tax=Alcanivorax quisquiliarum TaxID=2933565 RepID=A0ABT0E4I7_9GAMM|nr:hypothetical protein [Alcanivorax quisquiliarum]MCK0536736.1 hypothetical protein [Alcanivorax quisquiliarum]